MELFDLFKDNVFTRVLLTVIVLLIVQLAVKRFLGLVIRRIIRDHKYASEHAAKQREDTVTSILGTGTAVVLWVIGIIVVLTQLGVDLTAAATGAGLIGIIIGFGAQSTIKNLLSGLFIILENQYRVGDIVTINETSGIVENLTIRITRLRDLDGNMHIIQNGDINLVTNRTFGYANVNTDIGVAYDSDLDKVEKVVNETGKALAEDADWKDRILEPIRFFRVDEFADSAIIIKCLGKVMPAAQWEVAGEFRRRLKKAFDAADIEIPFPQRVIHEPKKK